MAGQLAWGIAKPTTEDSFLQIQSDTEAYFGHLQKAQELTTRAVEAARRAGLQDSAAGDLADAAVSRSVLGDTHLAHEDADSALKLAPQNRDVQVSAALAFALAGDSGRAHSMSDDLNRSFPSDTLLQHLWLPTLRAIELQLPNTDQAVTLLQDAAPYELSPTQSGYMLPVYVRAYLHLHRKQAEAAVAEFQKILDHRGLVQNAATGALAHLGIARAYALQGDTTKARAAYQDFLTLWKDADPDIPILKQAEAEYAKLQ
jgi:eukaryotic-like serine/threonine-protein kinase